MNAAAESVGAADAARAFWYRTWVTSGPWVHLASQIRNESCTRLEDKLNGIRGRVTHQRSASAGKWMMHKSSLEWFSVSIPEVILGEGAK